MVNSARPLHAPQIAAAREMAARSGLVIESRNTQASLATIRTLATAAGHRSDIGVLSRAPVLDLALTIVGVPAGAALAGWILAGRRPPSVARQPLD
jgi:hypothetical protein